MIPIETDRLIIRCFSVDDWQPLCQIIVQFQASKYAAFDQQWPTSHEELRKVVEWFARGDAYLAVCLREGKQLIGFVCMNAEGTVGTRQYNLGYIFDPSFHGKGYATEACRTVIDRAFRELGADRVVTGTAAENVPSCRLLERLGFRLTEQSTGSFTKNADGQPIEF
jgi:[ribosomal protein S5]-alanine N-acetyltransferase